MSLSLPVLLASLDPRAAACLAEVQDGRQAGSVCSWSFPQRRGSCLSLAFGSVSFVRCAVHEHRACVCVPRGDMAADRAASRGHAERFDVWSRGAGWSVRLSVLLPGRRIGRCETRVSVGTSRAVRRDQRPRSIFSSGAASTAATISSPAVLLLPTSSFPTSSSGVFEAEPWLSARLTVSCELAAS